MVTRFERRVLVLRGGVGGPPKSRGQVARALNTSAARVARAERRGLRGLRSAAQSGGCPGGASRLGEFPDLSATQIIGAAITAVFPSRSATASAVERLAATAAVGAQSAELLLRAAGDVLGVSADSRANGSVGSRPPPDSLPVSDGDRSLETLLTLALLLSLGLIPLAVRFGGRRS